ncbi:MAG: MBL fold metallo-hydrolase [Ilumatobacteraceae bacterium]
MTDLRLTHIGGPTVLLEFDGWRLLTDPTFDPPGRRYKFGWGTSSRKVVGPALAVDDLGPIDAVLLTHDHHADNLDDAGRRLLADRDPTVITTIAGAGRLGPPARGLAPWETSTLEAAGRPTVTITATPCRHGPPGSHPIVGDVVGFALTWEGQRHGSLWITGDTVLYPDLREVPDRVHPGTVLLHLGGVRFPISGPLRYTMTADDAVDLLATGRAPTIVPVHYEGWSHFQGDQQSARRTFAAAGLDERVRWATPGSALPIEC